MFSEAVTERMLSVEIRLRYLRVTHSDGRLIVATCLPRSADIDARDRASAGKDTAFACDGDNSRRSDGNAFMPRLPVANQKSPPTDSMRIDDVRSASNPSTSSADAMGVDKASVAGIFHRSRSRPNYQYHCIRGPWCRTTNGAAAVGVDII